MDRCQMEQYINHFNVTSQCSRTLPRIYAEGKENPLVALLVIAIVVFLLTIFYYRYQVTYRLIQLRRTGVAPFNPPTICPIWVYPEAPPPRLSTD